MKRGFLSLMERVALAWEGLIMSAQAGWSSAAPARARLSAHAARVSARPLTWGSVYVVGFCLLAMLALDRPVAGFFKSHISGEIEGFFKTVTRLGEAQLYLIPAGLLFLGLMLAGWRAASVQRRAFWRRRAAAPGFLFLTMAVSGLTSNAIKISLGRMRPRYWFEQGLYGFEPFNTHWGMNSFPSGHSQAAFAAMTALMVIFPRHAALWLTVAVLVAFSRVATTVHWLSDALAGSWLAICVTVLLARWFRAKGWLPGYSSHSPL
ncbi:phosphatase PAP2 family protein [Magnetospirillum sulfuroxidans]|uniref:Phosphatase PAP2 family protein n=1 Tax=Magnetospirillum sulfuroxidans TaxID=611300 RepID=A0ABS5IC14_9PROT|nr:phosphatase PAP2 family protein [Magnetospirillum sulfuroxidans]MBR9971821.1 phosphatase PAP2 family protein [Magnetospirillum sulfuroxidans]